MRSSERKQACVFAGARADRLGGPDSLQGGDGGEGVLESSGGKASQQDDQEHHVNDRFPDVRSLAREVEARQGRLRREEVGGTARQV